MSRTVSSNESGASAAETADAYITEYKSDHRNRLTNVTFKNNLGIVTDGIDYLYDAFDRRIEKRVDLDGPGLLPGSVEAVMFDGDDRILSYFDLDGAGPLQAAFDARILEAQDQVFAVEYGGEAPLYPLLDHLGSVRDLLRSGAIVNHTDYSATGVVTNETNPSIRYTYGFTALVRDKETGLLYSQTRYYDPLISRWISEDWITFRGGDTLPFA